MKSVSIRFDSVMLQKLRYIASQEIRSVNGQVVVVLQRYITEYELANGPVPLRDEENGSVDKVKRDRKAVP